MKNTTLLLLYFIALFTTKTMAIAPSEPCLLIDHLIEVNAEWKHQIVDDPALFQPIAFKNDTERIQKHLEWVTKVLKQRNTNHLNARQKVNRQHQLSVLQAYYSNGQFPQNTNHSVRQPYFVDRFGTACAVGHLLLEDHQNEIVDFIVQYHNYDYLRDMPLTEVLKWAIANGLTTDELAWIQPAYAPPPRAFFSMGEGNGMSGVVHRMITNPDESLVYLGGNFTEIDGQAQDALIAFDGDSFIYIDHPIDGTVHDLQFDQQGNLWVVGDFTADGGINLAVYGVFDGLPSWKTDLITSMDGIIKTIEIIEDEIYIGGDFSDINGDAFQSLARFTDQGTNWENNSWLVIDNNEITVDDGFGIMGTVNDLLVLNDRLVVGGELTETAPALTTYQAEINQMSISNLATWNGSSWDSLYNAPFPINTIYSAQEALLLGGKNTDTEELYSAFVSNDTILEYNDCFGGYYDNKINSIVEYNGLAYVLGKHRGLCTFGGITMINALNMYGYSMEDIGFGYVDAIDVNDEITAACVFGDELLIAGKFTEAGQWPVLQLARTTLEVDTYDNTTETTSVNLKGYYANDYFYLQGDALSRQEELTFYDVSGKAVANFDAIAGIDRQRFSMADLLPGIYLYQIMVDGKPFTGKISKF